jgi:hypothetical protein
MTSIHTKKEKLILHLVFAVWLVFSFFGMLRHEVWLDEAHHWLLARDSTSVSNLFYNARYDGHPLVWELLLFVFSGISKSVLTMQVVHLFISSLACFLFLRHSTFRVLEKVLIIFGYFFFFEYNLISRNYSLGWLFLVILCIQFTRHKRNDATIIVVLFLLANSHFFSLICSVPFFLLMLYKRKQEHQLLKYSLYYSLIYVAGVLLALWQIVPPNDSTVVDLSVHTALNAKDRFVRVLAFLGKSGFYIPDFTQYQFWNTNFLFAHVKILGFAVAGLNFIFPVLCLRKKVSVFIFYCTSLVIALALFVLPLNAVHYLGYYMMLLLVCLWLDRNDTAGEDFVFLHRWKNKNVFASFFLWSLFIVHAFSGVVSFYKDVRFPFSEGKNTAAYIKSQGEKHKVFTMSAGPTIASYLNEKLYYPEEDNWSTFCTWNTSFLRDKSHISERIKKELKKIPGENVFLVIGFGKDQADSLEKFVKPFIGETYTMKKFDRALGGENFMVFSFRNNPGAQ